MKISRRELLAVLAGTVVGACGVKYLALLPNVSSDIEIDLPTPLTSSKPSFEVFYALSKLVTIRESLDVPTAKKMFPLFIEEPWGAQHISSTYNQLINILKTDGTTKFDGLTHAKLGAGESWFVNHLITTWYLGLYFHESSETKRVAYKTALMFEPTKGILPIPFVDSVGFGGWTEKP